MSEKNLFVYFVLYAFIGWLIETFYVSIRKRKLINRGFLHGPFIPVYGFGFMSFLFVKHLLPPLNLNWLYMIFFSLLASGVEYYTSVIMETIFQTRLWDYSHHKFNLNGRICLEYSVTWGILGYITLFFLHPEIKNITNKISPYNIKLFIFISAMIFSLDLLFSLKAINLLLSKINDMKRKHMRHHDFPNPFKKTRIIRAFPYLMENIHQNIHTNIKNLMNQTTQNMFKKKILHLPDRNNHQTESEDNDFFEIASEITEHADFKKLKNYKHHDRSIYEHVIAVAYLSYKIAKMTGLDKNSIIRGALLHDYFFYDWRSKKLFHKGKRRQHAFEHPKIALKNASKHFKLNKKEKNIILSHMWPLTFQLPRFKESFVVSFADKMISSKEFVIDIASSRKKTPAKEHNHS